jgi:hypothetical protein
MSKRLTDRERLLSKLDYLTDIEVEEVLDFVSCMETKSRDRVQRESPREIQREVHEDELLTTLSSARENRRARQVFEWESIRRKAEARTGSHSYARR